MLCVCLLRLHWPFELSLQRRESAPTFFSWEMTRIMAWTRTRGTQERTRAAAGCVRLYSQQVGSKWSYNRGEDRFWFSARHAQETTARGYLRVLQAAAGGGERQCVWGLEGRGCVFSSIPPRLKLSMGQRASVFDISIDVKAKPFKIHG